MDPITNQVLQGVAPFAGAGSTLERNALIGVIRNLINQDKYTVDYILSYCESCGYQRQMAEDIFKELTGLSPKLIVNNNEYYNMPAGVPNMCIAWGISKSNKEKAFYIVPFEYGYATMETDGINAPIPTIISATIPEAFEELKKVAKNIQTLDKIITKKLLEAEDIQTIAKEPNQTQLPYSSSPLQILKKNFKDKVLSVSEFERQASKLLASEEITVDEAEDLMAWKQDLIDEDETYGNDVLELDEDWNQIQATVEFEDIWQQTKEMANNDEDFIGFKNDAKAKFEANKELFKNVDLIEGATRLYQLLLGFSKDEILGHSKFESKSAKVDDSNFDYTYISKEEWDNTPDDYKMLIDGIRYMMFPINHENGGKLCPVKIKKASFHDIETLKQIVKNMKEQDGKTRDEAIVYLQGKVQPEQISEILEYAGFNKVASKKVTAENKFIKGPKEIVIDVYSIDWNYKDLIDAKDHGIYLPDHHNKLIKMYIPKRKETDDTEIEMKIREALEKEYEYEPDTFDYKIKTLDKKASLKKITAENMTLDDIEAEDNKDQVQEEIEKIEEKPTEDIFSETTPEQYFEDVVNEDKVDTINDVVSKCIDKFNEKFKDFSKYTVKILSYNTKVLGDYKPVQEEIVQDKEINANAILQVILSISNNADESNIKKALAVFSITNGELHWTGTIRGENDQVVAFTEEGLDSLFEVEDIKEDELEDIISI